MYPPPPWVPEQNGVRGIVEPYTASFNVALCRFQSSTVPCQCHSGIDCVPVASVPVLVLYVCTACTFVQYVPAVYTVSYTVLYIYTVPGLCVTVLVLPSNSMCYLLYQSVT